jgi:D-xylose transport system ATP-binding protein
MPLLELRDITKDFPGVRALDGVSFTLERGEIHALCGENGAGKSTLIKVFCGVHPAGSFGGGILLDGRSLHLRGLRDSEECGIALIAQELALVPGMSVAENIVLGREPLSRGLIRWEDARRTARDALAQVGLTLDPDSPVGELGVGQQQMVEIAKALSKRASVLVLDEPTAALPEADTNRLLGLLKGLSRQGVSCIYISHRLEEVFRVADRVTVLRDGRSVWTRRREDTDLTRVIAAMVGREVRDLYPRPPHREGRIVLRASDWSVEDPLNPGRRVVEGVSLEVREGEVLGVAGLMGAGRTALLASLFGAGRGRVTGRLALEGVERPPFASPGEAIASGVALVSEDRKRYGLVLESGVGENLVLASLRRYVRGGWIDHAAAGREARERAAELRIKAPGLSSPVRQLSGGNQQKVVVGKWLLTRPKVLLLDEPTRGIDVGAKAEMYDLIGTLAGSGMAVVLVSSDLPEVLGISHRVLIMNQGRAAAVCDAREATPERVLAAATLS